MSPTPPESRLSSMTVYPELAGRRVFIAGAPLGIGSRLARAFAANRCRIVLHFDRHREHMFALAERIRPDVRGLRVFHCGLSDPDTIDRLTDAAAGAFGGFDIVLALASPPRSLVGAAGEDPVGLERLAERALRPVHRIATRAAGLIAKHGQGGVILYVSTQQPSGVPAQDGLHAMIRGGLEAMTADQAEHWADLGIRVHAIVPGLPQFEPSAAGDWHALAGGQAQAPVRRREADRIAALALSLCSTRAEALSGITHSAVG